MTLPLELSPTPTLSRRYTVRQVGKSKMSYGTTVPKDLIEVEAKLTGLNIDEFLNQYEISWEYGLGAPATVTFTRKGEDK